MLLNFGLQKKAPNIVTAPKSNVDVNSVLGLAKSQYDGLQSVGDTGYYYGDGRMYQPYTPSPVQYGRQTIFGFQPVTGQFGMPYQPSYGIGGGLAGGISARGGAEAGTIYKGDQAFRPVSEDVTGFTKSKGENDIYDYAPSMAYVYANRPRPEVKPVPNVTSFLSTPTPMTTPTGNYGAGRFLGTNGLLGLDYGLPSGQSANE